MKRERNELKICQFMFHILITFGVLDSGIQWSQVTEVVENNKIVYDYKMDKSGPVGWSNFISRKEINYLSNVKKLSLRVKIRKQKWELVTKNNWLK